MKLSRAAALLSLLLSLAAAWALGSLPCHAGSIPPERWIAHGPGTLTCTSTEGEAPGRTVERIEFQPNTAHADPYWCSGSIAFQPPQKINTLSFRYKPSEQRPVVVKVSDAAGRSAYFNLPGADHWMQARFSLESPDQLDGPAGALGEVTAVEFIFNNGAFRPGTDYTLLVADMQVENVALPQPKPLGHVNWLPLTKPTPVPGYRIETTIWNTWG
ncbi:MAG: hypothetical protein M3Y13_11525, partial [Armatimonadota bacterium]|nr:hypothetical protein [Armatimonadota bacterium]